MARNDDSSKGKENEGGSACGCGEYRPDQVCPDHAPWNQPQGK